MQIPIKLLRRKKRILAAIQPVTDPTKKQNT